MDAGIAVAIRDVDLSLRGERCVSAAVERFAAHKGRRLARHAEFQQYLAVERDLADEMSAIVGQEHPIVGRHVYAVGPRILTLTPRAQEISLSIEDHHRVLAPIEHVDVVAAVDADPANFLEGPAHRQFRPVGVDPVSEFAASNDHRRTPRAGSPVPVYRTRTLYQGCGLPGTLTRNA